MDKVDPNQAKAVILPIATFHFANPGKDHVQNEVIDVLSESSQSYLGETAIKISRFEPTRVLLEYDRLDDAKINKRYSDCLRSNDEFDVSEIEQLGFRIARQSGLERVDSFDERNTPWKAQEMFERLKLEPSLEKRFHDEIQKLTHAENQRHSSRSLRDVLRYYNSPEMDHLNKSLYITTNVVGVDNGFEGADAAASWWHRNFRMYARIQKFAQPGERIVVVGGQGHISIIRDFLRLDSQVVAEDSSAYL